MIIIPLEEDKKKIYEKIEATSNNIMAKCACVSCNSCTCACSCRSIEIEEDFWK